MRSGLIGVYELATDLAGTPDQLLDLGALSPPDGALQTGEVFLHALADLQQSIPVVEKDIAPHDRIGGGDAREVPEAAGGELHDQIGRASCRERWCQYV